jgi:hypothetical protein
MNRIEELPFNINIARTSQSSDRLLATRNRAYGRHEDPLLGSDHFHKSLSSANSLLISAESKVSGECFGSVRIESNSSKPFYFESEVEVPQLAVKTLAVCASRLNVTLGPLGKLTRAALCKSLYLYAHALQCSSIFAFVDKPRARLYTSLGFKPALDGNPLLNLNSHDGLEYHLFVAQVSEFRSGVDPKHPLYDFVFNISHPDIRIFSSVGSREQSSRMGDDSEKHSRFSKDSLMPTLTV